MTRAVKARQRVQDRRRANRLRAPLPVAYVVFVPDTPQPLQGQGILKDISLTGLFFHVPPDFWFGLGQTVDITVASTPADLENPQAALIKALGKVVRLIPPDRNNPNVGVAVHFLQTLTLAD